MKNINLYLLTWNIQDILPNEKLAVKQYSLLALSYVIYMTLTFTEHLLCAKHGSKHLKHINTFNHTTSLWRRYFYYLDIAHKGTETQSI